MDRSFKTKNGQELTVSDPTFDEREDADIHYNARLAKLLRDKDKQNLFTRDELHNLLLEKGVWTEEDNQKITDLHSEIADILAKVKKGGFDVLEGRRLIIEVIKKRNLINEVYAKRQKYDNTTVEALAEDQYVDFITYLVTKDEQGEKYLAYLRRPTGRQKL